MPFQWVAGIFRHPEAYFSLFRKQPSDLEIAVKADYAQIPNFFMRCFENSISPTRSLKGFFFSSSKCWRQGGHTRVKGQGSRIKIR
jgi:hypothetical protein